jgi:hypothetical protein
MELKTKLVILRQKPIYKIAFLSRQEKGVETG